MKASLTKHFPRAALILAAVIWGSTFSVMKELAAYFSEGFIMCVRFGISAVFFLLLCLREGAPLFQKTNWRHGLIAGLSLSLGYLLQTAGLALDTTPSKSAFLTSAYCVFVPLLTWLTQRKAPKAMQMLASLLCAAGIGLISLDGSLSISLGDALTLLGSIGFAANIVALEEGTRACTHTNALLFAQFSTGALLCGTLSLRTPRVLQPVPQRMIFALVLVALFASALCMWLQTYGLRQVPSQEASILLAMESVFGALFSVLLYGERLSGRIVMGFFVILGAILLAQSGFTVKWRRRRAYQSGHL